MFAVVIRGDLASVHGAIVGSYVVGIATEVGTWAFGFSGPTAPRWRFWCC